MGSTFCDHDQVTHIFCDYGHMTHLKKLQCGAHLEKLEYGGTFLGFII